MSSQEDIAISINHVQKYFKLPTERSNSIKQIVINWIKGIKGYKKQTVLKDISFDIKKGDFYGIVGRNGSGKSTLLKIISGIYFPNKGSVKVNGSLVSFIELGVGFNPELTGRENIYLNGALMGFKTKEIDDMYQEIVEFAELEDFMDQKLKNYSSGMQVRLAFSCAIRAHSDILVLDEILAVGDEAFQKKCNDFFAEIKKDSSKTVVLVTHSMDSVRKYCNKAVLIHDGKIEINGTPEDVANAYSLENALAAKDPEEEKTPTSSFVKNCIAKVKKNQKVTQKERLEFEVSYTLTKDIETYIGLTLWDIKRNQPLINSNSIKCPTHGKGKKVYSCSFDVSSINNNNLRLSVSVRDKDGQILHFIPHDKSPIATFSRTDYPDPQAKSIDAVLFDRGKISLEE